MKTIGEDEKINLYFNRGAINETNNCSASHERAF
jgi:hypothetical protein